MDPLEVLAKTPILEGVPESDLKRLLPSIRSRSFGKGSYFFREGDLAKLEMI
jgi:CRP-like cAMP-binding protein